MLKIDPEDDEDDEVVPRAGNEVLNADGTINRAATRASQQQDARDTVILLPGTHDGWQVGRGYSSPWSAPANRLPYVLNVHDVGVFNFYDKRCGIYYRKLLVHRWYFNTCLINTIVAATLTFIFMQEKPKNSKTSELAPFVSPGGAGQPIPPAENRTPIKPLTIKTSQITPHHKR